MLKGTSYFAESYFVLFFLFVGEAIYLVQQAERQYQEETL